MVGAMEGIGFVVGPLLGGVLTTKTTWRWCFWINLPVGAITAAVIGFLLQPPSVELATVETGWARLRRFDWMGTITFVPSTLCLLLALQWGGSKYPWTNVRIIVLFIVFGVLLAAFIATQVYMPERASVPLRVVKNRSIIFGALFAFSLSSALSLLSYYLPLWFQGIKDASALDSGVMILPIILGMAVGSVLGGVLVTLIGYYPPMMGICGILTAVGSGLLTTFTVDTPQHIWIGYLALAGIGAGLGFQQPLLAAQTVLEKSDVPTGTSLMIFAQSLAGTVFISVGNTIFLNRLVDNLKNSVPQISAEAILALGATNLRKTIPTQLFDTVLVAYNDAIVHTFYASAAMSGLGFFLAFGMEMKLVKKPQVSAPKPTAPDEGLPLEPIRRFQTEELPLVRGTSFQSEALPLVLAASFPEEPPKLIHPATFQSDRTSLTRRSSWEAHAYIPTEAEGRGGI